MAIPEHLVVVKSGKAAIDVWRKQHNRVWLDLKGADLRDVDLSGADLSHAALHGANLQGANLCEASMLHTDAPRASFVGANLTGVDISVSNLVGAEFDSSDASGANLKLTNLSGATFSYSDFSGATLEGSDLSMAVMKSTQLTRTNFTGVRFRETVISDCDLSQCIGIETNEHRGLSTIGTDSLVDTVRGAGGNLSFQQEAFFIGAGVPSAILEDVQNRAKSDAMKLYTSLITFSLGDTKFAHKLFQDLKKLQIICWKIDDADDSQSIKSEVEGTTHSYDKMIVVCSKDSLNRAPVLEEIGRALLKERRLKSQGAIDTDVLFLVQRDHYMQSSWNHPLKGAMLSKYSGDFTSESSYRKQVVLLVKALHLSAS
ncbi:MAG: toll/interleukin-1 receptor domain-containing protein [Chloroflexi bacterium]|nr:toll/interleukin-1 receptor domain-containing protein [Chloroflexota bacterium]